MANLDRRQFLSRMAGTAAAWPVVGGASTCAGQPKGQQPNILFIFSDQQRWDTIDCYGSPLFEGLTPNLDRLAQQGVRFQNAFTCQPVCGPARSCLQTGKYATETGCFRNGIALPQDETTIAHRLSEVGYDVGYIGKWHLASTHGIPGRDVNYRTEPIPPERRGGYRDFWLASDILEFTSHSYDGHMFDGSGAKREFPKDRYRVDAQTDWALEYLEQRDSTRPFFLFVSYIEPHHQNDHRHFEGPRGSKERFADYRVPGDLAGTKGDWRPEMPDYLGCCWSLDQNVGRIMDWLERKGLRDNTLVVYTSDHACHFRTRNGEYKRACHDNAIRVPMIIRGPGFQGGAVVDRLASLIDLPPTLLRAAGVEPPRTMQGRPLQDAVAKDTPDWPEEVFAQISESQVGRTIRTHRWKYSVRALGKSGGKHAASDRYTEDKLYDLKRDPHERDNRVTDPNLKDVRAELAGRLKKRMVAAGESEPEIVPQRG